MIFTKIVTGGQTGVDRAALDAALEANFSCGGWCPRGRLAEDGVIENKYPLTECDSSEYAVRTELNARDSDGTLILAFGELTGGTKLTEDFAIKYNKPCLVIDLLASTGETDQQSTDQTTNIQRVFEWCRDYSIKILNLAGPRESHQPGVVYTKSLEFISSLLSKNQLC
jgi:hypothetical protein